MGTNKVVFEGEQPEVIPCACLTRSDVTRSHVTFPLTFFPYFFPGIFFPSTFFPVLFPRTFSNYFISISSYFFPPYFFPVHFFPVLFFPRTLLLPFYFPVLFPMSRRLKSNVLKYQLVVFLEHVVITQFMYLAEYSFKRHRLGFTWTSGVCACAI